jgi:hypothetical protein
MFFGAFTDITHLLEQSSGGVLLHKNGGGYFEKNDVCGNGLDGFFIREVIL